MKKRKLKQPAWKEAFEQNYVAPLIVGVLILTLSLVINPYFSNQEIKKEIDYRFDKANNLLDNGHFEEAINEYEEISKISYNKFPDKYALT
jgi:hypothetical protein